MREATTAPVARKTKVQKIMPLPTDTIKLMLTERVPLGSLFKILTGIKRRKDLYKVGKKTVNCPEILANTKRKHKILQ